MTPKNIAKEESELLNSDQNQQTSEKLSEAFINEQKDFSIFLLNKLSKASELKISELEKIEDLSKRIKDVNSFEELTLIKDDIKKLSKNGLSGINENISFNNEANKILSIIINNLDKIILDDNWLAKQIRQVHDLVTKNPDSRKIKEAGELFKQIVKKQETLKTDLIKSQNKLENMLSQFMDGLSDFSKDTGAYQEVVEQSAEKIAMTTQIDKLNDTLMLLLNETKLIQIKSKFKHDELEMMKMNVQESQTEISRLREELERSEELVRIDALTGVLNRKGMMESLEKAEKVMLRTGGSLCVALLDVDNFKSVNDCWGHRVGDQVLQHLANIVRDTIRPQDILARYGGEEFVVILDTPETEEAINVMKRVQLELSKQIFTINEKELLITFSCGVAKMNSKENPEITLTLADKAMYLAKKTGKNKIVAAN